MRNGETPIDTNDFFRKKVEFKKEGDDLVVIKKQNNGEHAEPQQARETELPENISNNPFHFDRLKKIRKEFKEKINSDKPIKKPKEQEGIFVDMNNDDIVVENNTEAVVAPAEAVQAEEIKADTTEEQKTQEEKPEVVFNIENKLNELKKKKTDIEEIIANYKKALSESNEERIMQRINSRIQDEKVKINKVNEEIVKLKEENIRENGVDLKHFNNLRDRIAEFEAGKQYADFKKRMWSIKNNEDSEGKNLSEKKRNDLIGEQKEELKSKEHQEYLKNKQELEEIFKAAKVDKTK